MLLCSIYCPFLSLVLSIVYYLCRPLEVPLNDKKKRSQNFPLQLQRLSEYPDEASDSVANADFRRWWRRGCALFLVLFFSTYIATCSCLVSLTLYYQVFFSTTDGDYFCSRTNESRILVSGYALTFTVLVGIFSIYIVVCSAYFLSQEM